MAVAASGNTIRDRPSASTQMISDNGDIGERLRRLNDDDRAAVAFLLTLVGLAAGPSTAAAPVVSDDKIRGIRVWIP